MTKDMEIKYLKTLIRYYQKLIRKLVNNKELSTGEMNTIMKFIELDLNGDGENESIQSVNL